MLAVAEAAQLEPTSACPKAARRQVRHSLDCRVASMHPPGVATATSAPALLLTVARLPPSRCASRRMRYISATMEMFIQLPEELLCAAEAAAPRPEIPIAGAGAPLWARWCFRQTSLIAEPLP